MNSGHLRKPNPPPLTPNL